MSTEYWGLFFPFSLSYWCLCMAVSIGPCSPSHVYSHPLAQLNLFSGRDFISHRTMLFQYHYMRSHWLEPLDHFMVHDYAVAPLEPKHSPDSLKWSLRTPSLSLSLSYKCCSEMVMTDVQASFLWDGFTLIIVTFWGQCSQCQETLSFAVL